MPTDANTLNSPHDLPEWAHVAELPFVDVLPQAIEALQSNAAIVVEAPPGAGKTTVMPLVADYVRGVSGKTLVLEPRRAAARSAALRLASIRSEKLGGRVGYRMRDDTKVSEATRIEFVTEAILSRMIQSDPELTGYSTVIFDEFHERHLASDFGLALALDVRAALRPDLSIVVMSATLDADPIAALIQTSIDEPVTRIQSEGRAFPVTIHHRAKPWRSAFRYISDAVTAEVTSVWNQHGEGSVLVFLPGVGEIKRCYDALKQEFPTARIDQLYGSQSQAEQRAVIEYNGEDRRIVLATPLAESALTLRDVRAVVDSGLVRRPSLDPSSGMSRLVTERISKAEAAQRAGRAGRVSAGQVYRLWTEGEHGGLLPFPPAEIERTPMTRLALDLCEWGDAYAENLSFLTPPPPPALTAAHSYLRMIEAVNSHLGLTEKGQALHKMPFDPRLATILYHARFYGQVDMNGVEFSVEKIIPVLLTYLETAHPRGDEELDLYGVLEGAMKGRHISLDMGSVKRIASHISKPERNEKIELSWIIAQGYPDRIAKRRSAGRADFLLASGQGVAAPKALPESVEYLVAINIHGDKRDAVIKQMCVLEREAIESLFHNQIEMRSGCQYDPVRKHITCAEQRVFGHIAVHQTPVAIRNAEGLVAAQMEFLRNVGLSVFEWPQSAKRRLQRARFAFTDHRFDDDSLIDAGDVWLPFLAPEATRIEDFQKINANDILDYVIDWTAKAEIERLCPSHWTAPDGRDVPIDLTAQGPEAAVRLTSLYGLNVHPHVGAENTPLRMTLLSPANRPLQITTDITRFWQSSYPEIRKEMRGRYPKHDWPEDPLNAVPKSYRR